MVESLGLLHSPRRRSFVGHALTGTCALGVATKCEGDQTDGERSIQVLPSRDVDLFSPHHCGYIFGTAAPPARISQYIISRNIPCIVGVDFVDDIRPGDIIEINNGLGKARVVHQAHSNDHSILLTNRCNSNCIMCPDSEIVRRFGQDISTDWIDRYLSLIPLDTPHLSLTGGEPTLLRERLFTVLDRCKRISKAHLLLLTNARMFYYRDYVREFATNNTRNVTVATALHSSNSQEHDSITAAKGSFFQTVRGVQNLVDYGINVELRIVIQRSNCERLLDLSRLIAVQLPKVSQVSFMGLEVLGNAAKNRDAVWIDYQKVRAELSQAIILLLENGITSRIYNLPLCNVDHAFWSLCAKSISPHKRTYKPECVTCSVRSDCGGLFAAPLNHKLTDVKPV